MHQKALPVFKVTQVRTFRLNCQWRKLSHCPNIVQQTHVVNVHQMNCKAAATMLRWLLHTAHGQQVLHLNGWLMDGRQNSQQSVFYLQQQHHNE